MTVAGDLRGHQTGHRRPPRRRPAALRRSGQEHGDARAFAQPADAHTRQRGCICRGGARPFRADAHRRVPTNRCPRSHRARLRCCSPGPRRARGTILCTASRPPTFAFDHIFGMNVFDFLLSALKRGRQWLLRLQLSTLLVETTNSANTVRQAESGFPPWP
jgi:hypothetical protein